MIIEMRKKFGVIASRSSSAKVAQFLILLFYFVFLKINLRAVVISLVGSSFVALVIILPSFFDSYEPWRKFEKSSKKLLFKILFSHGKWEVVQPFFTKIISFVEPWAIKLFVSTEAVAIYSIAQTLVGTVAGFFPTKTLSTLIPLEANNEERMRKIYTFGIKYLIVFSLLEGVVAFFAFPIIINLFFKKYLLSLAYFKVLLFTLPLSAISAVSSYFLVVLRRQKFLFFQKILKISIALPLYFLFLPIFGLWGLVIQNFILSLFLIFSLYYYLKNTEPRLFADLSDFFHFGEQDRLFARNISSDVKKYISKKLLMRS